MTPEEVEDTLARQHELCQIPAGPSRGIAAHYRAIELARSKEIKEPCSRVYRLASACYERVSGIHVFIRTVAWVAPLTLCTVLGLVDEAVATGLYALLGVVLGASVPERSTIRRASGRKQSSFSRKWSRLLYFGGLLGVCGYWAHELVTAIIQSMNGDLEQKGIAYVRHLAVQFAWLAVFGGVGLLVAAYAMVRDQLHRRLEAYRLHLALGTQPKIEHASNHMDLQLEAGDGDCGGGSVSRCLDVFCSGIAKQLASRWDVVQVSKLLPRHLLGLNIRPRGGRSERAVLAMILTPDEGGEGQSPAQLKITGIALRAGSASEAEEVPEAVVSALSLVRKGHRSALFDSDWFDRVVADAVNKFGKDHDAIREHVLAQTDRFAHVSLAGRVFTDGKARATNELAECKAFDHCYAERAIAESGKAATDDVRAWFTHTGAFACPVWTERSGHAPVAVLMVLRNATRNAFDIHDRLYIRHQAQRLGRHLAEVLGNGGKGRSG